MKRWCSTLQKKDLFGWLHVVQKKINLKFKSLIFQMCLQGIWHRWTPAFLQFVLLMVIKKDIKSFELKYFPRNRHLTCYSKTKLGAPKPSPVRPDKNTHLNSGQRVEFTLARSLGQDKFLILAIDCFFFLIWIAVKEFSGHKKSKKVFRLIFIEVITFFRLFLIFTADCFSTDI